MANTTPAPAANPSTAVIIASHLVPSYDVPFAFKAWRYQRIHPKGETPCDHLQSPQKLPDLAHPDEAMYRWPPQIIAREKGGSNNNHVQWIKSAKLVALNGPDEIAFAHGVLIRDSGEHSKEGDKVWLMSEDPLQGEGGKIVHVVNLDQLIDTTVS
ncbi:hypothetical protein QBC38DRAFT_473539 [Podospora fimiseda]|uniref:Uncharacterized protein n=1 Tax=Podospora fimiseda TaxID=252190 RepID=A0AAN7H2C3_9PEZI|nr:hypothetical protein QBC38DRAFT_473539 [Podospora fimiseda]